MQQKVWMSILGGRSDEADDNTVELITKGLYTLEGEKHILEYDESQLSGLEDTVTTMTVEDGVITMSRRGQFSTEFIFKSNQLFKGSYQTPYGNIIVDIFPTLVDYKIKDGSGKIDLEYTLDIGGESTVNQIMVNFGPENR